MSIRIDPNHRANYDPNNPMSDLNYYEAKADLQKSHSTLQQNVSKFIDNYNKRTQNLVTVDDVNGQQIKGVLSIDEKGNAVITDSNGVAHNMGPAKGYNPASINPPSDTSGGSPQPAASSQGSNPMQSMMSQMTQMPQKMMQPMQQMGQQMGKPFEQLMQFPQKLMQQIQQMVSQGGQGGAGSGTPTSDTMTQGDTMEDKNHDGKPDGKDDSKDHDGKSDSKTEMKYVAPTPTGGLSNHGGNNIVDLGMNDSPASTPVVNAYGQTTDSDPNQLAPFSPLVPKRA